jgi:hypothetical protein
VFLLTSSISVTWCCIVLRMKLYCHIIYFVEIDNQWAITFSILTHIYMQLKCWYTSSSLLQNWITLVMHWNGWREEAVFCDLYIFEMDGQWTFLYSIMSYISTKITCSIIKMTYSQEMNECLSIHWGIHNAPSLLAVTYARHMRTLCYQLHRLLNG